MTGYITSRARDTGSFSEHTLILVVLPVGLAVLVAAFRDLGYQVCTAGAWDECYQVIPSLAVGPIPLGLGISNKMAVVACFFIPCCLLCVTLLVSRVSPE